MSEGRTVVVVRLETAKGAPLIDFSDLRYDMADSGRSRSEPVPEVPSGGKTKSASPAADLPKDDAPLGKPSADRPKRRNVRGARTYSEVVVETYERERHTSTASDANDQKHLSFVSGHKNVQKTEGILHFYRKDSPREDDLRMVCVLGVSANISCQDVLTCFAPALPSIERIKIVRDGTATNTYMMLILFKSAEDAELFYRDYNGVRFNQLEPDRVILLYVESMDLLDESAIPDLVELPTCAVCLERMDDGVITIYCRHSFHAECIQKCTDTICPICRCTQTPEAAAKQRCSACDESTDLWICLICGNVACGRYREAHAFRHFEETSHTFAQEVGGNRVWDYAGDNYVHRLIQAEQDGKLVAYERGGPTETPRGGGTVPVNVESDEKVEAVTLEYTCLLTNQLDDQRRYFERKLNESERARSNLEKMALAQMEDLEAQLKRAVDECEKLREEVANAQQYRTTCEKRHTVTQQKMNKLTTELNEERSLNTIVRADQEKWSRTNQQLQRELVETRVKYEKELRDVHEQLSDLMLHLEGVKKLETQAEEKGVSREEVEHSSLEVVPGSEKKKTRRKSNKK